MTKNPTVQGETKSAPKDIAKLPRFVCPRCRLESPAPIVTAQRGCSNDVACARRVSRATRAT